MNPVLSPPEWGECFRMASPATTDHAEVLRMAIALSNAQLPDGDPLKFTIRDVNAIRTAVPCVHPAAGAYLMELADRIQSILPTTEH